MELDDLGNREDPPKPCGAELLRSVGAGLGGIAAAAGIAWGIMHLIHPSLAAFAFGIPAIGALAPGFLIGLLDRRRSVLTALIAALVFSVGFMVVMRAWEEPGNPMVLFAFGACFLAMVGAGWGGRVRGSPRNTAISVGVLVGACVIVFVVPEVTLRRDAHRFADRRSSELLAIVGREVVTVPDGPLQWRREPQNGFFRGVELQTTWEAKTQTAGAGRCALSIRSMTLSLTQRLDDSIYEVHFSFVPRRSVRLRSQAEAAALLGELGVRVPPGAVKKDSSFSWSARWGPDAEREVQHSVAAKYTGAVEATRQATW